jgi:hypothetical protein
MLSTHLQGTLNGLSLVPTTADNDLVSDQTAHSLYVFPEVFAKVAN